MPRSCAACKGTVSWRTSEAACRSGLSPRIEDYLGEMPEAWREELAREMRALEQAYRDRTATAPTPPGEPSTQPTGRTPADRGIAGGLLAGEAFAPETIQASEEGGERLTGAGRRENECVLAGRDRWPAFSLGRRGDAEGVPEPLPHRRQKEIERVGGVHAPMLSSVH